MASYEEKICQAIQIMLNKKISDIPYDRTITARIAKCINKEEGKYLVKFQDSQFYAYSLNQADYSQHIGKYIYVLIPNGDMRKKKLILALM